jgi:hypothetical protein
MSHMYNIHRYIEREASDWIVGRKKIIESYAGPQCRGPGTINSKPTKRRRRV